ncbi:MAG: hypothetical protein GXO63_01055 [Candidatus Micrarchaeota archaeon]|nr:hypothetical protein [Candidatus Micrarchaeota archaeon]
MKEKVRDFIYEWLGRKRTKRHIDNEFTRHYRIAASSSKYIFTIFFLFTLYYWFRGINVFDVFFASLVVYFFSSFAPDIFYLVWKIIRNDKSYIPSEKRIYSHRFHGMLVYALFIFFLFLPLGTVKACVVSFFAFLGYWVHLTTDRIELLIDRGRKFFERVFRE